MWESPELRLVIFSRTSDPRSGVLEYRVTKIRRTEPSARLFESAGRLSRPPEDEGRSLRVPDTSRRSRIARSAGPADADAVDSLTPRVESNQAAPLAWLAAG
jgi:hypothetical protein